jgi:hypothetical protein
MSDSSYLAHEPGLVPERLMRLAQILVVVRKQVNESHESATGETNLSRGTRTYERARKAFRDLATTVDWLGVVEEQNAVVLRVGGVPLKFHRADPERVPSRMKDEHWLERNLPLPMPGNPLLAEVEARLDPEHHWRLLYETHRSSEDVASVHLLRYDSDDIAQGKWDVPLEAVAPALATITNIREAEELDKPAVGPLAVPAEKADGRAE